MPETAVARPRVLAPPADRRAAVLGLGTALPAGRRTSAEIAADLGIEESWILTRTGIRERRIAAPDDRLDRLAAQAGAAALEAAGVDAAGVDLVLVATFTPDEHTPNAAPLVAHRLGATRAGAWDVGAACTGFLSALAGGAAAIESGRADTVLLVGADLVSRFTDPRDRATAALFADGAGAVVLGAGGGGGLGPVVLRTDGTGAHAIRATRDRGTIEMNGPDTFRQAVGRLTEVTHEAVAAAGIAVDELDLLVFHQANARITRAVGGRLGVDPDRVVDCIAELGNTSAATLPLALAHAHGEGRLRPGHRVLLAAFGAGFTWGGAVLEWGEA